MTDIIKEYPQVDQKFLVPNNAKVLEHLETVMHELYDTKDYDWLDVRFKTVLDIGAYLGDTAIYFARRGATNVIALEPLATFDYIQENIKLNLPCPKVVMAVRAYVGTKFDGINTDGINDGGSRVVSGLGLVRHYSLRELIDEFQVPKGSMLKIDAEGGEYAFFTDASKEDLCMFDKIIAEIHWIPSNDKDAPERKLTSFGFDVRMKRQYAGTWLLYAELKA
jgi:FkbM family methyltransferase